MSMSMSISFGSEGRGGAAGELGELPIGRPPRGSPAARRAGGGASAPRARQREHVERALTGGGNTSSAHSPKRAPDPSVLTRVNAAQVPHRRSSPSLATPERYRGFGAPARPRGVETDAHRRDPAQRVREPRNGVAPPAREARRAAAVVRGPDRGA
jgi:hypothetical protein